MKILITGGAGYVGSKLAYRLIKEGHEITIFDNLAYSQNTLERLDRVLEGESSIEDSFMLKENKSFFKNFNFEKVNLENKSELRNKFKKFDVVFHFGEIVSFASCNKDPERAKKVNFFGSKNIIDLCKKTGCKLIYNSSSSVYGFQKTDQLLNEEASLPPPGDEYVKNKLLVEEYLKRTKPEYLIFRPATVGGLSFRMRMELLPHHFSYALQVKKQLIVSLPEHYRSLVHIEDLIDGYCLVLKNHEKINQQTYNIGNDVLNLKKIDFVNKINNLIGAEVLMKEGMGDLRNLRISSKSFSEDFDYKPKRDLIEIVKPVLDLLKKDPCFFDGSEHYNEKSEWDKLFN